MNSDLIQTEGSQNQKDATLNLDLLKDVDLTKYPPHRLHFLISALQKGTKLPSESSMRRCEIRNERKAGVTKANSVIQRRRVISSWVNSRFRIPRKFGVQPSASLSFNVRRRGKQPTYIRIRRPARVIPKKSISLPTQIQAKNGGKRIPKSQTLAFRNRSPYWIVSKAARERFRLEIQNYYKLKDIKFDSQNRTACRQNKPPAYFQKKKENQKRRRRQKHLLIQSNRQALKQIFGDAIFSRGWPVSRKQIKLALGIKEEDHMKPEFLCQFMEMAEKKRQLISTDTNKSSIKLAPLPHEVSRMVRRVTKKEAKENVGISKQTGSNNIVSIDLTANKVIYTPQDDQFPSLLS